jgi:hypothetical protein
VVVYGRYHAAAFDLAGAHARRWELPAGDFSPQILLAAAVGDRFAYATSTGVGWLGPDGAWEGGVDPLPCHGPSSGVLALDDRHFAAAAGEQLLVYEVGASQ